MELLQVAAPHELGIPFSAISGLFGALYPIYVRGQAYDSCLPILGNDFGNNVLKVKIQVTMKDTTTNKPVSGADIAISDGLGAVKAHGSTGADGTLQLTYVPCADPETKQQTECSGKASKARYQDVYFFTPFQ